MSDAVTDMHECDSAERSKRGLSPRTNDFALASTAQELAEILAGGGTFSHSVGGGMSARAARNGWTGAVLAENIAYGNDLASETFSQWMKSPGHRANILDASTDLCGFGHATSGSGEHYWAANYGAKGFVIGGNVPATTGNRVGWLRFLLSLFGVKR